MHWDDLRFFLSVARTGQIGRAAPSLRADPTTVSRRIRRLEQALGASLFIQDRHGQRLTSEGEALLAQAEAMDRAAAAIGDVAAAGAGEAGHLRISAPEGFGTELVAPHLAEFSGLYPRIQIDLTATSGILSPAKRETDIAILLTRPRRGPLTVRRLADYGLALYAAPAYLAQAPGVTRDTLSQHRLVGYIPDQIYAPELDYLNELAPGLEARIRSSSINAQYRLCVAGAGLAILPAFMAGGDAGLARVLPDFALLRTFWVAIHQDVRNLSRVGLFNDWLTDLVMRQAYRLAVTAYEGD